MRRVVILGSGPAGLTAALYTARAGLQPLVIEGFQPGGQLASAMEVENFPGFPEGIMGPELMFRMRQQAERFGAEFRTGWVTAVDFHETPLRITLDGNEILTAESVIIATGASPKLLGIPGERELLGHGVSTSAQHDGFSFRGRHVLVVGGGDAAMEEALFLSNFAYVTVVHRRRELRASQILQERARMSPRISWELDVTALEVLGDENGFIGLRVRENATGKERVLFADGMFVAIGRHPNTSFLVGHVVLTPNGYVWTEPDSTRTSVPGVFACGEVKDDTFRQAITAAGSGCMAALECERFLLGRTSPQEDAASTIKKISSVFSPPGGYGNTWVPITPAGGETASAAERFKMATALQGHNSGRAFVRVNLEPKASLPRSEKKSAKIVAVHSVAHNTGKSQIAINLAAQYRLDGYERVLMMDLDYQGSTIESIAYEGPATLADWEELPPEVQPHWEVIDRKLTARFPDIEVHAIPLPKQHAYHITDIPVDLVERVLDVAIQHFDVIVVDLGTLITDEARLVIERASAVIEVTVPKERYTRTVWELHKALQKFGIRQDHFAILINKDPGALALLGVPVEVRKQYPWPICAVLPLENSVIHAYNQGKLMVLSYPHSEFASGIKRVIDYIH